MGKRTSWMVLAAALVVFAVRTAQAIVTIDTVPVGNVGNADDTRVMNDGTTGYGAVNYAYNIGKYEVTAGQYTALLNAVAKADPYGLYDTRMLGSNSGPYPYRSGCQIQRTGSSGTYVYSVAPECANRPVNWVTWGDAARFANWLTNGQPTGAEGLSTTEDGSYFLNGAVSDSAMKLITRKTVAQGAQYVIPSEDEWYKAAYYDPSKSGGAGYWEYPTKSDTAPVNVLSSTGANNANFYNGSYTTGAPYWTTEVGSFAQSVSPYGTFDQGGNVEEWTEAIRPNTGGAVTRGGGFAYAVGTLRASNYGYDSRIGGEDWGTGFRVASVPEPGSISLLVCGAIAGLLWRRRKA